MAVPYFILLECCTYLNFCATVGDMVIVHRWFDNDCLLTEVAVTSNSNTFGWAINEHQLLTYIVGMESHSKKS